jgi:3-deoxy-D-manno-octulosonic-acid transferase
VHAALRGVYGAVGQCARGLAAVAPASDAKLIATFRARRGIRERFTRWGTLSRRLDRPLLWVHAPSVGEALMAQPVIALVRRDQPATQVAFTHFSPSAERFARSLGADFADYLPFDTPGDADAALSALRPTALVFSKLDVWPTLAASAADRGVRLGLISATLAAGSARTSAIGRALLRSGYERLDLVGAIDAATAERLVTLGVSPGAISVTGDTRYDQVWERAAADRNASLVASLRVDRPTLVAGSTWPADEHHLLPAVAAVRRRCPTLRLIIAPHEPSLAHLAPIERWAREEGIVLARLGGTAAHDADVVLVDRVGVLGDLYALADIAFVGGGFHAQGLHSVIEPAAFGAPVLFGPAHNASRDADLLLAAHGAIAVRDAHTIGTLLGEWISDAASRHDAGARARAVVETGRGAAAQTLVLVLRLLSGR